MTNVLSQFTIKVAATGREECVEQMDRVGLAILEQIGGAPWLVPDDDIKKVPAQAISGVLADSDGFCYFGTRTYDFRGPIIVVPSQTYHDGFTVQGANE